MILKSLILENFRSFTKRQEFVFPQDAGLYFMQGVNQAEPRLDANGSGKSTVWEALLWCLYGKTSRGLKAGDVCNWTAGKRCSVILTFEAEIGGGHNVYFLKRTWGPISWTLSNLFDSAPVDLVKDPSNAVLAALRLEYGSFLNCILTAQNQPMFIDQRADQKAALFAEVLQLDAWLQHSTKASKKASTQDAVTRRLEAELARLQGRRDELQRSTASGDHEEWEAKRAALVDALDVEFEKTRQRALEVGGNGIAATQQAADARRRLDRAEDLAKEAAETVGVVRRSLERVEESIRAETRRLDAVEVELRTLRRDGNCPTCGQSLRAAAHEKLAAAAERIMHDADKKLAALRIDLGNENKELRMAAELSAELSARLHDCRESYQRAQDRTNRAASDLARLEAEMDRIARRTQDELAAPNPFVGAAKRHAEELAALDREIEVAGRDLDDSRYAYNLYSFWVRGFKDMRLQQIATALSELEVEVNSSIEALGLVGWELHFHVDRETKSGTIQRGFSVAVQSPHNTAPVPWEAWSGGEAQRLRIATTMGFSALIRARTGTPLNLEVWDEPTTGLSPQGVQDLLEALASRARVENRQIWVVDHRSQDFGGFAGGAVIVKTESGSVINQ